MKKNSLHIQGASEHNLKSVNTDIPHDQLVVVTGLSGSGKSSLAYHTVYAEGQRRYIETFSPYTRQFLDRMKKPEADRVENVRPAVAIRQRARILNSRSTVGSMTDIYDYLRILWANLSIPYCPNCQVPMRSWSVTDLVDFLFSSLKNEKQNFFLVTPFLANDSSKTDLREELLLRGYSRIFNPASATIELLEECKKVPTAPDKSVLVVLDRFSAKNIKKGRLREAIQESYRLSSGRCILIREDAQQNNFSKILKKEFSKSCKEHQIETISRVREFRNYFFCASQEISLQSPRPSLFSFNHPIGACPECKGFGKILKIDPDLCIPNPTLTLEEGAVHCWAVRSAKREQQKLLKIADQQNIPVDVPWRKLSKKEQDFLLFQKSKDFTGVIPWFQKLERKSYKMHVRVFLARYRNAFDCPECEGKRLKPDGIAYRMEEKILPDLWAMPIGDLREWIEEVFQKQKRSSSKVLSGDLQDVFESILVRLRFLEDLGLPYLTLDRQARTLSGGEVQRVNLAAALGSNLVSTQFVLDEPSIGLHPRDTGRLMNAIRSLTNKGNSLLVVEHDPDVIEQADTVLTLGPAAGEKGGNIVPADKVIRPKNINKHSPGAKNSGQSKIEICNAHTRNLQGVNVQIPLQRFVTLSGVSGSGKSTLVSEVLLNAWKNHSMGIRGSQKENAVKGFSQIQRLELVDQSPLAKNPRANIATYSKLWDSIRELLAATDAARTRALSKSAFSFNVEGGRCPACKGAGYLKEDMQFLSDIYVQCEVCLGKRFQPAILEVQHQGYTVDDFLQMTVNRCSEVFRDHEKIQRTVSTLSSLGLGHLRIGHPLSDLSGGEAQRLKLVPYFEGLHAGETFLIFDEPTTGLHQYDVERLIILFQNLVKKGHSILCVEHNLQLIAESDWIIDLGPEGGAEGGKLILEGSPETFLKEKNRKISYTAKHLQDQKKNSKTKKQDRSQRKNGSSPEAIQIRGAKEHNLKNIDLDVPLSTTIALCGVSGSGKSTIARDILAAEGQRRYLDCLSPYARQYIRELKKPEVDAVLNIPPSVSVHQHTFQPSQLSTIATMSEVYHFLRLLYSKAGDQLCPDHPQSKITHLAAKDIAKEIARRFSGEIRILAPVIVLKKGFHREVFQRAIDSEISEVRVDGIIGKTTRFLEGLERSKPHTIEFVIAKCKGKDLDLDLLTETVSMGLSLGSGALSVLNRGRDYIFSTDRSCPECKKGFLRPDPEDFSFNSRRGACASCSGTGKTKTGKLCKNCNGSRLKTIPQNVRVGGYTITDLTGKTATELSSFLRSFSKKTDQKHLVAPVLEEALSRLDTIIDLGLDYLPLSRECTTLSSGELQRLRIAAAIGSPLSGVLYIFDEPSAGLHPKDNVLVLDKIHQLAERNNSVILIEHDLESILSCEHIIEVGPEGGRKGGEITYNGPRQKWPGFRDTASNANKKISSRENTQPAEWLKIKNASKNNLKNISINIPLQKIVTVAGVSGAGKSSLVHGVLFELMHPPTKKAKSEWSSSEATIKSSTPITRVVEVDQKPIGRNSRSTPASYLGIWNEIRKLFAATPEAKARGRGAKYFSYNTGEGRCSSCGGNGEQKLEMSFLPEARVPCEYCEGLRFSEEANAVLYNDFNISEVLQLTFTEAKKVFANHRKIHQPVHYACELGLGYLQLGQSSATLSGGESQRLKLVSELGLRKQGHSLYLLDEPTTGLHPGDVFRLVQALQFLAALGNSVVVIEHDRDFLSSSDYVIELGPGPAESGGKVIFEGSPDKLKSAKTPWGKVLKNASSRKAA